MVSSAGLRNGEKRGTSTSGDETWVKLLSGVVRSGDFVRGHIDGRQNFDKLIDHYSVASHSSFAARQSSSAFSTSSQDLLRCITDSEGNIKWQQTATKSEGKLPSNDDVASSHVISRIFTQCRPPFVSQGSEEEKI